LRHFFQRDALGQSANAAMARSEGGRICSALASSRNQKYCSNAALEMDDFTSRLPTVTENATARPSSDK
jgi:hypothetical protein